MKKLQQGKHVPLTDRIGHLNLIAFERTEFLKKIQSIREAFRIEHKNVKEMCRVKMKEIMEETFQEMLGHFKDEYGLIVDQYNKLLFRMYKLERVVKYNQEQTRILEHLNVEKDTFYDMLPVKYIPMVEELELCDRRKLREINLDEQELVEANTLFT